MCMQFAVSVFSIITIMILLYVESARKPKKASNEANKFVLMFCVSHDINLFRRIPSTFPCKWIFHNQSDLSVFFAISYKLFFRWVDNFTLIMRARVCVCITIHWSMGAFGTFGIVNSIAVNTQLVKSSTAKCGHRFGFFSLSAFCWSCKGRRLNRSQLVVPLHIIWMGAKKIPDAETRFP